MWITKGNTESMFGRCLNLVGGRGTIFNNKHYNGEYGRIDGGTKKPGYFTKTDKRIPFPYGVLSGDTLTYYYDNNASNADCDSIEIRYMHIDENIRKKISTVVFDSSMANCNLLTSTWAWFFNCEMLTSIVGIENLKTHYVRSMDSMFSGCSQLKSLDLSCFNTDRVVEWSKELQIRGHERNVLPL